MPSREDPGSDGGTHAQFPSQTQWTVVVAAGGSSSPEAKEALNKLCQTYWCPVYSFIRRSGHDSHTSKDLAQGFFVHLLEADLIKKADKEKGRFRSFLCASVRNFVKDERRKEMAQKRGGSVPLISIDETEAEEKVRDLPAQEPDPAKVFDRIWAATVIEQATASLKQEYARKGRTDVYEALKRCLTAELAPASYPAVAAKLGMTKQTLEVNLSRFKDAFGKAVRSVIAETVSDPAEIDDEIRYLMAAWARYLEGTRRGTTKLA